MRGLELRIRAWAESKVDPAAGGSPFRPGGTRPCPVGHGANNIERVARSSSYHFYDPAGGTID